MQQYESVRIRQRSREKDKEINCIADSIFRSGPWSYVPGRSTFVLPEHLRLDLGFMYTFSLRILIQDLL